MGNSSGKSGEKSSSKAKGDSSTSSGPIKKQAVASTTFCKIPDNYMTIGQVTEALHDAGIENSNLIVAVDFTKSNEWTGKLSFGGRCLHQYTDVTPSPYEEVIRIIGATLSTFDDDNLIPCYGFGDGTTRDQGVFSFNAGEKPCHGMDQVVSRYREIVPCVRLSGPTSFAPAIYSAMRIVANSEYQYHILLIVADGQVTRSEGMPDDFLSPQEDATIKAIVAASEFPLSIIMVGVGDGPWDVMMEFDDQLPARKFDNFQFVNFTELAERYQHDEQRKEAVFALSALMEVPEQYKAIKKNGLLRRRNALHPNLLPLDPPEPVPPPPQVQHQPQLHALQQPYSHMNPGHMGMGGQPGPSMARSTSSQLAQPINSGHPPPHDTQPYNLGYSASALYPDPSVGHFGSMHPGAGPSLSNLSLSSVACAGYPGAAASTSARYMDPGRSYSGPPGHSTATAWHPSLAASASGHCVDAGVGPPYFGAPAASAGHSKDHGAGPSSGGHPGMWQPGSSASAPGRLPDHGSGPSYGGHHGPGPSRPRSGDNSDPRSGDPFGPRPGDPGPAHSGYHAGPPPPSKGSTIASDAPPLFLCPITQEVMSDPVNAADGYTYDRSAIEAWLWSHNTSPMTNQHIEKILIPNFALRSAIAEWK